MTVMFDTATANPGTGGLLFAVDSWDDGGVTHVLPYSGLAFGALNGPYTVVDVGTGFPVDLRQLGGTSTAVNAGAVNAGTLRVVIATDQPQLSSKLLVTPDLPSGASTAAKQPALGTAGTASSDVITVQGIASMTKLLVTPDSVALPANQSVDVNQLAGTATSVNSGLKDAGTLRVVLATDQPQLSSKLLVTPDSVALPANQSVNVNQLAGTATSVNSGAKDAGTLRVVLATDQPQLSSKLLVTPDSVALPANQSVNVNQLAGTTASVNSGVKDAGTLRVVIATDQPALSNKLLVTPDLPSGASTAAKQPAFGTAGTPSADVLTIQGVTSMTKLLVTPDSVALPANQSVNLSQVAGGTTATGHGTAAGALRVELPTDSTGVIAVTQSGTWTVEPGNTANTTPWLTTPSPAAAGGPSTARIKSAATTNATSVKGSAGQVYGFYLSNQTTAAKFVKFYNKATAPTVGSDTPVWTLAIPPNGGAVHEFSLGVPFATGIGYAITGLVADSDTTAVAVDDVTGILLYK